MRNYIRQVIRSLGEPAIWLGCAAAIFGGGYLLTQLVSEDALDPPGWDCSLAHKESQTGKCYPKEGWHFEEHPQMSRIAVRDFPRSRAQRQLDIDTALAWQGLKNAQRREILEGRATVYDYRVFESANSK